VDEVEDTSVVRIVGPSAVCFDDGNVGVMSDVVILVDTCAIGEGVAEATGIELMNPFRG
jgi:hypothetical protein